MNTTEVLGFRFVSSDILEAVEDGMRAMDRHEPAYIVAMDSEKLLEARKNKRLEAAVRGAELLLPEGSGILYASHIQGLPLPRRISAMDYASALMARMSEKGRKVVLIAQEGQAAALAAEKLKSRYPGIFAAAFLRGDYDSTWELLDAVNAFEPELLLVGFGSPKQELWMQRYREYLRTGLMLGFGKEMPVLAGLVPPVPQKWREGGTEWVYRMLKEPQGLLRTAKNSGVLLAAVRRRLFGS